MTIDMNNHRHYSTRITERPIYFTQVPPPFKRFLEIVTHYDTPKVVRFESIWIASLSLFVKLSLAVTCICLMWQRTSYQIFDRSPISAVTIKVKASTNCSKDSFSVQSFPNYNCRPSTYDVNDFILPPTENSAVSITTRMVETEHVLRYCSNTTGSSKRTFYSCYVEQRCIAHPHHRDEYGNVTEEKQRKLCWFELPPKPDKTNYQALDYILFVKNYIEFPRFGLKRDNLAINLTENKDPIKLNKLKRYMNQCEYDPMHHKLCPKFRISKILDIFNKTPDENQRMFNNGALIEIKINWKCNLDRGFNSCNPSYEFQRLEEDSNQQNSHEMGSNFITAKHFFSPDHKELHRVHTNIYNLHIIVSVTGDVGKFDLFQITTSIGSFLGIFSAGAIVCDLIAAFFTNLKRVKYDS